MLSRSTVVKNVFCYTQLKNYSFKQQVRTNASVTLYGSQLDDGRRSSKYPCKQTYAIKNEVKTKLNESMALTQPSSATVRGMRIEQPRFATPAEKSWIDDVSCFPVKRRSLSFPPLGS